MTALLTAPAEELTIRLTARAENLSLLTGFEPQMYKRTMSECKALVPLMKGGVTAYVRPEAACVGRCAPSDVLLTMHCQYPVVAIDAARSTSVDYVVCAPKYDRVPMRYTSHCVAPHEP